MRKVFVKTFGCAFNKSDSERILGVLDGKFDIVDSVSLADFIVVNSCGVKAVTQDKVVNFIKSVPEGKEVFVGGCLTKMVDMKVLCPGVKAVFDTNSVISLPEVLESGSDSFSDVKEDRLSSPVVRLKDDVAIIPICQGCLGACNYCSVRFARGSLKSYSLASIVKEVKKAVADGCKRINLTAQDAGCWGLDIGSSLPVLLKAVLAVEGDFIVRVGMANPDFVVKYLDELVDIFKSKKVLRFLHVPLQSGSDAVLKSMGRKYSVSDFVKIVKRFREVIPDIYVCTDIIVGYPSETEEDFQMTVDVIRSTKPDVVNISRFGSRLGTEASKMEQLPLKEIVRRSNLLHEVINKKI